MFVPLRVVPELPPPGACEAALPSRAASAEAEVAPDGRVEIILPDGTVLRVAEGIALPALRRLLSALRG